MIKYVFLDLDDTLFDFHKAEAAALSEMLLQFGITPTESVIERYSEINLSQWKLLELKKKTREEVLIDRFAIFFSEMGLSIQPKDAREIYESALSKMHFYIDDAPELLESLFGKYKLYLASNGTLSVQTKRIGASGIAKYFDGIFISQEIGHDKPSQKYFEECFSRIEGFSRENAIIIGDSLSSDIQGGINAKIKTCLYNPKNKTVTGEISPDFIIKELTEIPKLLSKI